MDSVQTTIMCSRELYGDWVSINKTAVESAKTSLVFVEVRVFGVSSKYKTSAK